MKKVSLLLLSLVLVIGIAIAGCAKPAPAPAPKPGPSPAPAPASSPAPPMTLDIGLASPLTGPSAFLGSETLNGCMLAIEDRNAKGGITIAGQKYMLNPVQLDTKNDAATGKSVAEDLIFNKKVKIIAGPFQSDAIGVQTVTEPNKVLAFFINSGAPQMVSTDKPFSYFCSWPVPQMTYKLLNYIHKTYPEAKTVYSMETDIPLLPVWVGGSQDSSKLLGLDYQGYEKVPLDTRDFTPIIARVLTHNPDVIDLGGIGGTLGGLGALAIKQIRQAGFNGVIMIPAAPPEEVVEQTVPAASLDKVITQYIDINGSVVDPKYRNVMNAYKTKYKQEPVDVVTSYYNVLSALFDFLNTQNTMDTTAWTRGLPTTAGRV